MDIHVVIEALHQTGLFPDFDGFVNFILFMIILMGFIFIVAGSKKYRHLIDYLSEKDLFKGAKIMMSENDYLLDEIYREIDLIVNTAEDEEEAIISILESPYPFDEEQALKLVRRFKKSNQREKGE